MKKIFLLSILVTLLIADNPRSFSQIGDPIYNSSKDILKLKFISEYMEIETKIDNYYFDVDEIKDIGFSLDATKNPKLKMEYLKKLRVLDKNYGYFKKRVFESFIASMRDNNNELFSSIINSKLIYARKYKRKILKYYLAHIEDVNPEGVIEQFLDEDERARKLREARLRAIPTKKQLQERKIKRLRAKDKARREARERRLEKELEEKKYSIRIKQIRELRN